MKRICVITDNRFLYEEFFKVADKMNESFEFYCSSNDVFDDIMILDLKQVDRKFLNQFNGYPIGATIHEMNKEIDGGAIIAQESIVINDYETSDVVYRRILELEVKMIKENLVKIIENTYTAKPIKNEGNINYKKDFAKLCCIDLTREGTFGEFVNILRATTFHGYDNAFFYNQSGEKIYVSINLKKANN